MGRNLKMAVTALIVVLVVGAGFVAVKAVRSGDQQNTQTLWMPVSVVGAIVQDQSMSDVQFNPSMAWNPTTQHTVFGAKFAAHPVEMLHTVYAVTLTNYALYTGSNAPAHLVDPHLPIPTTFDATDSMIIFMNHPLSASCVARVFLSIRTPRAQVGGIPSYGMETPAIYIGDGALACTV